MADDNDDKEHDATEHRRQQAREQGQVVKSQDLGSATMLVVGLLALWYMGNGLALSFARITREHLGGEAWVRLDVHDFLHHLISLSADVSLALLPVLGTLVLAGVLVNIGEPSTLRSAQLLLLTFAAIAIIGIAVAARALPRTPDKIDSPEIVHDAR